MTSTTEQPRKLGVGVIGAGEVFQVCHGPCLLMLSHLFTLESVYDISPTLAQHTAAKYRIPQVAGSPGELLANSKVDVILVLTSDESHADLAILGLEAGKHVLLEKPMTLSIPTAQSIIDAEKKAAAASAGGAPPRVFVGYMRRYAPSFLQAFKREIASMPRVAYARVRDFSGPNANFVNQSGTFPVRPPASDFPAGSVEARTQKLETLFAEAFSGISGEITDAHREYNRFLGSLGSHDFSLMREALGFPDSVSGVSVNHPFYSAILNFKNKDGSPFSVTYESGIDNVPEFDAHLSVYGMDKRVTIKYDSPYVKGLPIKVEVEEVNEHGELQKREVLSSYEDTYTAELQEFYGCVALGKPIKTSAEDAIQDLKLYDMMYKAWEKQRQ